MKVQLEKEKDCFMIVPNYHKIKGTQENLHPTEHTADTLKSKLSCFLRGYVKGKNKQISFPSECLQGLESTIL